MMAAKFVCSALLLAFGVEGTSYNLRDRQGVIMSRRSMNGKRYCITAGDSSRQNSWDEPGLKMKECNGEPDQQWRYSYKEKMLENAHGYYMEASTATRDNMFTSQKSGPLGENFMDVGGYRIDTSRRKWQMFSYDWESGVLTQRHDSGPHHTFHRVVDFSTTRMTAYLWTPHGGDNQRWDFVEMKPNMSSDKGRWEDVSCSYGRCNCERGTMRQYKSPYDSNGCGGDNNVLNRIQEGSDTFMWIMTFGLVEFDNKPCCHAHDYCYSTVGKTHIGCDGEFVSCLDPFLAWWMGAGVTVGGVWNYYDSQKAYVKCWVEGSGRRLMEEIEGSDSVAEEIEGSDSVVEEVEGSDSAGALTDPADGEAIDADPTGEDITFIPFNPDLATEEGFHKAIAEGYFDKAPSTVTVHLEMNEKTHELAEAEAGRSDEVDEISQLMGEKPASLGQIILDLERRIKSLEN